MENKNSWIGVDLDKTLAEYNGWDNSYGPPGPAGPPIGKPIAIMVDRVRNWLADGITVKIFTARVSPFGPKGELRNVLAIETSIQNWCEKHIGVILPITNCKDFSCIQIWDDIAIQIIPNTGVRADGK